jgi:2,4-dienoyl-CoA reductase-like NADH-dependent reductase (Old Yellow Enzyme family)
MVVWKAAEDGAVTPAILEHYHDSAGPGLVIVEATAVSPEGRLARQQLGIFEDRRVEGLARIAEVIDAAGSVASIQLHHAGRNTNLENTFGLPLASVGSGGETSCPRPHRRRHRAHPGVLRRGGAAWRMRFSMP